MKRSILLSALAVLAACADPPTAVETDGSSVAGKPRPSANIIIDDPKLEKRVSRVQVGATLEEAADVTLTDPVTISLQPGQSVWIEYEFTATKLFPGEKSVVRDDLTGACATLTGFDCTATPFEAEVVEGQRVTYTVQITNTGVCGQRELRNTAVLDFPEYLGLPAPYPSNEVVVTLVGVCDYAWEVDKSVLRIVGPGDVVEGSTTTTTIPIGTTKSIHFAIEATRTGGGDGATDATATLEELWQEACASLGAGFTCGTPTPGENGVLTSQLTGGGTIEFVLQVTNVSACGGDRTLLNVARLVENDSDTQHESSAGVTVKTGDCAPPPDHGWWLKKHALKIVDGHKIEHANDWTTIAKGDSKTIYFVLAAGRTGNGTGATDATAELSELWQAACATLGPGFACSTPTPGTGGIYTWPVSGTALKYFAITVKNVSACGGERTLTNTARLVESDSRTEHTASASVKIKVPACEPPPTKCDCVRSYGYWKNKKHWPSPYDQDDRFFGSGKTWEQILATSPGHWPSSKGGNGYIQLAHQYIAATLNRASMTSMPGHVQQALDNAKLYFEGRAPRGFNVEQTKNLLDRFNNGKEGRPYCKHDHDDKHDWDKYWEHGWKKDHDKHWSRDYDNDHKWWNKHGKHDDKHGKDDKNGWGR